MTGQLHEECGVFGVFGVDRAAGVVRTGLAFLQHRGQEGCGIACPDKDGRFLLKKGLGLVSAVLPETWAGRVESTCAIGHVRYGTFGGRGADNVQPFVFRRHCGGFATAHNGNIANAQELADVLSAHGVLLLSSSDSELFGALLGESLRGGAELNGLSLSRVLNRIDGAFSLLVLAPDALYACRDRYGLRPLSVGRLDGGFAVASETCALRAVSAQSIRDVRPGEIIRMTAGGMESRSWPTTTRNALCAMEYI